jgi:hypothetical protein
MDDITAADAPDDLPASPSGLADEALYSCLRSWFEMDAEHSKKWRAQAKSDFDFIAGEQWSAEDRAKLDEQKRPCITFNRSLTIIKAVAGVEINGRHDTVYLPRGTAPGAVKANELLTAASDWMADGCDAEDEQSEAFQDTLVCGMGWTGQRIAYDEEPDGKYGEEKIDPLEMYWDRSARSKNLTDARRVARVRKMTLDEARQFARGLGVMDILDEDLDATWAVGAETDPAKPVEDRRLRDENSVAYDEKSEVHIVHMQWIERRPIMRVGFALPGPDGTPQPQEKEIPEDRFARFQAIAQENGIEFRAVRQERKVYKQCFLGKKIIGQVMDLPSKDAFTFQCITGERDRNAGTFYGLVRLMKDPQMWANKWLSQTMHILNTTAKGGIIAEADAFRDQRDAQDTYAQPDAITWAAKGAISAGKIMQKPGAGIPTGYVNLLEFAITSIRDVTGINMELLGLRDANQPGVLEAQRKQAGMTILATMFDSLRRFRKQVGRVRLHFIQNHLADGRLILIAGEEGKQAVPLIRDRVLGEYQVIIEDAPTSPNMKQETWGFLMQLMPVFKDMLTPEAAIAMLEYSPLPSKLVDQFRKMMQKAQEPTPEQKQERDIAIAGAEAKVEKDLAGADQARASADATRAKGYMDLANAAAAGAQAGLAQLLTAIVNGEKLPSPTIQGEHAIPPQQSALPAPPMPQMAPGGMQP